jgi:hypothetical protein
MEKGWQGCQAITHICPKQQLEPLREVLVIIIITIILIVTFYSPWRPDRP